MKTYVPITPSDTPCMHLEADTYDQAWANLLKDAAHMPYEGIEGFQQRGYTVECWSDEAEKQDVILVFGSNLLGIHGAGAALHARKNYGAVQGVGEGRTGNAYALPTKRTPSLSMSLTDIKTHINKFLEYAATYPVLQFEITQVGCGLAGHKPKDIAPMFKEATKNCLFDTNWKKYLGDSFDYWGTV